ncbi:hypothetical protein [Azorhizobium doebereinerae]|uniref:hypothetical protein n=1 Tax=Azorhizobium doebereinerae TaxID=281091 RepID=UPI0004068F86|nr:hypothetical protein [Azorhizobium doebereinerae]
MDMIEHGRWAAYTPDAVHPLAPPNAAYWRHETTGEDWYVYSRRVWSIVGGIDPTGTLKIRLDDAGRVVMLERDAVRLMPPTGRVIELTGAGVEAPPYGAQLVDGRFIAESGADTGSGPTLVPAGISDRQFFQGLALRGLISQVEALAAVGNGTLPAAFETLIGQLSAEEQFAARMLLSGATSFQRTNPLVDTLGAMLDMGPAEIDDLWRFCAGL